MTATLHDVIQNTKDIHMTDSALTTLLDFERVLDEIDLYAFRNWKTGELAEGPIYEKYFVTCVFMWPYKLMPDPRGAERLSAYNCEIRYKKDYLEQPVKVKGPEDFKDGTKYPKSKKTPIWLVEIVMPKKLIAEINQGSVELENETVDVEDIEQAYETGVDDDSYKTADSQGEVATGQDQMQQVPGGQL